MKLQNLSLRWRLTALYVALLASVLILFSTAVYVALSRSLIESEDDALQNLALLLDSTISTRGDSGKLRLDDSEQTVKARDRFVRLYDRDGEVFDNSSIVGEVDLIEAGLLQANQGQQHFDIVSVNNERFRVCISSGPDRGL